MAADLMEYILDILRNSYRLPPIIAATPGPKTKSFVITTEEGSYLFAPLARYKLPHLPFDEAFTSFLAHSNFPAQTLARTISGDFTAEFLQEKYVLRTFFHGHVPDEVNRLNRDQIDNAARALAALHLMAQSYRGIVRYRLPYRSELVLRSLAEAIVRLESIETRSQFDEFVLRVVRRKQRQVSEAPFEAQSFLRASQVMNHGDFHPRNIVFDSKNRVIGILDFEYCTFMPRLWDIAWAVHWFSRTRRTEAFCGMPNLDIVRAFLSSYHAAFPLNASERNHLPLLFSVANVHASYGVVGYARYGFSFFTTRSLEPCTSEQESFWYCDNFISLRGLIEEVCL